MKRDHLIVVRGGGDLATGTIHRLWSAGLRVLVLEAEHPAAIRRQVSLCEAVYEGETTVEGLRAVSIASLTEAEAVWACGAVPVLVDPKGESIPAAKPDVVVDAILAKRNLGTTRGMAPVVIGVGPGFTAQVDVDAAVETMRGHYLGRVYYTGSPLPNTAIPGLIGGYAGERVLRAPADGTFAPCVKIGDEVKAGTVCGTVAGQPMVATIDGVVRGLLQEGVPVTRGMKSGDVDPRCHPEYITMASDKALAVGGGVLEAILSLTGCLGVHVPPAMGAVIAEAGDAMVGGYA